MTMTDIVHSDGRKSVGSDDCANIERRTENEARRATVTYNKTCSSGNSLIVDIIRPSGGFHDRSIGLIE